MVVVMEKEITKKVRDKYDKKAKSYDKMIGPMDRMMMGKWREMLCKKAKGFVLEAGVGTGANFPYYPEGIKVIGVDFSHEIHHFVITFCFFIILVSNLFCQGLKNTKQYLYISDCHGRY